MDFVVCVLQWTANFSSFLSPTFLVNRCKCRGPFLRLFGVNETHACTNTHSKTHTHTHIPLNHW